MEEAKQFDQTNSDALKKMQDLQAMIRDSQPNAEVDDVEQDDEFDHYMEEALMQEADSLGIFDASKQAAEADVYSQALKRVEQEVAKVPARTEEEEKKGGPHQQETANEDGEDLDKFGDDLMTKMMEEGS